MPYYNRRYRRRSSAQKNKRYIKNAKGAGAQAKQLLSLQRQVTTLTNKQKMTTQRAQYAVPLDTGDSHEFELDNGLFNVFAMTDFTGTDSGISAWSPL